MYSKKREWLILNLFCKLLNIFLGNIKQHVVFTCQRAYNLLTLVHKRMWSYFSDDNRHTIQKWKAIDYIGYDLKLSITYTKPDHLRFQCPPYVWSYMLYLTFLTFYNKLKIKCKNI